VERRSDETTERRSGAATRVATPTCAACPEGITRGAVIELCAAAAINCVERDVSLTEVYRAAEVFCTGTMGELVPVIEVDGRRIGDGNAGSVTERLRGLFREMVASEGEAVV